MKKLLLVLALTGSMSCIAPLTVTPSRNAGLSPDPLNRRPQRVHLLGQGWTHKQTVEWYHLQQGSLFVPLEVFDHLPHATDPEPFFGPKNLARYGFLTQDGVRGPVYELPGPNRQYARHGMPVGFALHRVGEDDGTEFARGGPRDRDFWVGMTCAACHTAEWHVGDGRDREAIRIEGAPSNANFELLLVELLEAYDALLEPAPPSMASDDGTPAERFLSAVLGRPKESITDDERRRCDLVLRGLREEKKAYVEMSAPTPPEGGDLALCTAACDAPSDEQTAEQCRANCAVHAQHGRMDAFGGIFNNLLLRSLHGNDQARKMERGPVNAPVSFPPLWDSHQAECVQWNGNISNKRPTPELAALGRNVTEALGTFAALDWTPDSTGKEGSGIEGIGYWSSVPAAVGANDPMHRLERLSGWLTRPAWPESVLGKIDWSLAADGRKVYQSRNCNTCHQLVNDPWARERKIQTRTVDTSQLLTDPVMADNYYAALKAPTETGKMKGQRSDAQKLKPGRYVDTASGGSLLTNAAGGVILGGNAAHSTPEGSALRAMVKREIGPEDTLDDGESDLWWFEDNPDRPETLLERDRKAHEVRAARTRRIRRVAPWALWLEDTLRTRLRWKKAEAVAGVPWDDGQKCGQDGEPIKVGYRARPLTGVWATAPYLHNGSVPTLSDMLSSPEDRPPRFLVGGRDFDPEKVGLADPDIPRAEQRGATWFDTQIPGNSNSGHDHSRGINDEDRAALIEFLKTL